MQHPIHIGTAAWAIPKAHKGFFDFGSSQLESYATRLSAVEINSSFYRNHQQKTYERWASCVPSDFRFSVKLYRRFTHEQRLNVPNKELVETLDGLQGLGDKLGVLLVQMPPSLSLEVQAAQTFFSTLRRLTTKPIVVEARHRSWTNTLGIQILKDFNLSKVRADPEPCPAPRDTHELGDLGYFRLHGSPDIYKSLYSEEYLRTIEPEIKDVATRKPSWCIFDNTTWGHATQNALELKSLFRAQPRADPGLVC